MSYIYGNESNCKLGNGSTSSAYVCRLGYQVNSQSIENNTSEISLRLEVKSTNSSYKTYGYNQTTTIDGTVLSAKSFDMRKTNTWQVFGERIITISHNADGTYSQNKNGSFVTTASGSYSLKSGEANVTVAPATIPRATTPTFSVSSVDMGTTVTITLNRAANSFTHTLKYTFGEINETIGTNLGTSTTWTPSITLANQIPNASSANCLIICETYDGSTLIGTKTVNLTLNVPSSVVPTINSVTISEANPLIIEKEISRYLQDKSQLRVQISASGVYGSSITNYNTIGIESDTYNSNDFTSNILTTTGNNTITITITDSRGRTVTTTRTYYCYEYSVPAVLQAAAVRCDSNGTENEEGLYLKYNFYAKAYKLGSGLGDKNPTFKIGYKKTWESSYTYVTLMYAIPVGTDLITLNSNLVLRTSYPIGSLVEFDTNETYDIIFVAEDWITSTSLNRELPTAFCLINYNSSGKGIAFGKVSQQDAFEVAMDMYYKSKILSDYILDIIYPVGSIYMSTANVSPETFLGGTWNEIEDRFLLAAGQDYTAGDVGGNSIHSHNLDNNSAVAEISLNNNGSIVYNETSVNRTITSNYQVNTGGSGSSVSSQGQYACKLSGDTSTESTMPPYLVVHMWERTA